jgi:preprotein translocase subunit SecF
MLHDVVLVVGIFAWLGKPIDGVFLAAALTIIGVSVNDSVVTMDRIRETWSLHRSRPARAGGQRRDHRDRARAPSTPASAPSSSSAR